MESTITTKDTITDTLATDEPKMSKSAMKKAAKKAAKSAKKTAKAAELEKNSASIASTAAPNVSKEGEMSEFEYRKFRISQIDENEHYPDHFHRTKTIPEFRDSYSELENGEINTLVKEFIAGRIINIRYAGKKLVFIDIQGYTHSTDSLRVDEDNHLQVKMDLKHYYMDSDVDANSKEFMNVRSILRRGDIIGAVGYPHRTERGELSIVPHYVKLIAPCLYQVPRELIDMHTRVSQRYLDMIVNLESVRVAKLRSVVVRELRRYLDDEGFLEVETPVLSSMASGAAAKPFETYHIDLKSQMQLRIAPELYLKRLIVGGMDKVFEIGKQFRNESIDLTHNPEFTTCEFYAAHQTHHGLMSNTENLLTRIIKKVTGGSLETTYGSVKIDWTPPYRIVNMIPELEKQCGEFPKVSFESKDMNTFLNNLATEKSVSCSEPRTTARLLDALVGDLIEPTCTNPTFIINHPKIMSPLAKEYHDNPEFTQRFELFVNGKELCNAYTELNNPFEQYKRFMEQAKDKAAGDEEAHGIDEDFCTALEYGMPPTAGWGMGIDRLIMFLANKESIRDVILFPQTKSSV